MMSSAVTFTGRLPLGRPDESIPDAAHSDTRLERHDIRRERHEHPCSQSTHVCLDRTRQSERRTRCHVEAKRLVTVEILTAVDDAGMECQRRRTRKRGV